MLSEEELCRKPNQHAVETLETTIKCQGEKDKDWLHNNVYSLLGVTAAPATNPVLKLVLSFPPLFQHRIGPV